MSWPALPKKVQGLGGPIRVLRPVRLDEDAWGHWFPEERIIHIRSTLPRETAWHTLLHELSHAMLDDASIPMAEELMETFCDLNAGAMLQAMRCLLPQDPA